MTRQMICEQLDVMSFWQVSTLLIMTMNGLLLTFVLGIALNIQKRAFRPREQTAYNIITITISYHYCNDCR